MKKWWLYLFFIVFLVSVVSAQYYYTDRSLGGYGLGDIVDFYNSYPYWFDFFISLIIFASLGKIVFGGVAYEKGSKGLTIGIAVALSFALIIWESRTGFNLGDIWWFALLILILAIVLAAYRYFKGTGTSLWVIAIIVLALGIGILLFLKDYLYYLPETIVTIFYFAIWIAGIYLFVLFLGWILGKTTPGYELPRVPSEKHYLARGAKGMGKGFLRGSRAVGPRIYGGMARLGKLEEDLIRKGLGKLKLLKGKKKIRKKEIIEKYDRIIEAFEKDPRRTPSMKKKMIAKLKVRRDRELGVINKEMYLEQLRHNRYIKSQWKRLHRLRKEAAKRR